ncbi:MAG: hypothetical protein JJU34_01175 [Lunatimonas sp.]|uniref:hypothetical protein n=1 Tax=Lunatimonas sp. TaxID=2060141 RepID=UPI00263BBB25|nr:hypothetical protein [Lunatimonas sp.]MCC5935867.1 hypothetical protein [Lunatimonas sp.]
MIKILKTLFFFTILFSISQIATAQVYLGGGRTITQFSPSSLEEYRGFGAVVQRQVYLNDSKFSLTPTLQGSLLTDKLYLEFMPEFYATLALATHLNVDIVSSKKVRISPFAGPSFIWATGLRTGGVVYNDGPINFYRIGLEGGLALTYIQSEKFSVKLIPLTYTFGSRDFVQGNVLSLLFQIM